MSVATTAMTMRGVATDLPRPIFGSAAASVPQSCELEVSVSSGHKHVRHVSERSFYASEMQQGLRYIWQ